MGGEAGQAFATWLGEKGEKGTGNVSTTVDYDTNNQLFASGKAAYTIQWSLGHRGADRCMARTSRSTRSRPRVARPPRRSSACRACT